MLNFIYYPVSAILWFWHKVFSSFLGPASGFAWALSVVFLVFTLRALLFKPFVNQVRTQRQMQEFQPQIKALQKKYAGDRQKLATEMQKLQKENGFNPIAGCLPVLAQAPVFIGLFHVLRSFNRTGAGVGQLGLSPEENRNLPNYVFSVDDVRSFLDAKLFGAPLSSAIRTTSEQLRAFGPDISRTAIIAVAIPLMIIAAIATHFTARASVARQQANPTVTATAGAPPAALMNKLVLWVFPFFVLVGGPFLPIAVLLYWLSNNGWTLVQQHYVFGRMAQEEAAKKVETLERRTASAPRPGAKPVRSRKPPGGAGPSLRKEGLPELDGVALGKDDTVTPHESNGAGEADPAAGGSVSAGNGSPVRKPRDVAGPGSGRGGRGAKGRRSAKGVRSGDGARPMDGVRAKDPTRSTSAGKPGAGNANGVDRGASAKPRSPRAGASTPRKKR